MKLDDARVGKYVLHFVLKLNFMSLNKTDIEKLFLSICPSLPYLSWLLHWHWGKHMINPVSVKEIWEMWVHSHLVWHHTDSEDHGANMGPTWVLWAPDGPHVGPMKLVIRAVISMLYIACKCLGKVVGGYMCVFSTAHANKVVVLVVILLTWKGQFKPICQVH